MASGGSGIEDSSIAGAGEFDGSSEVDVDDSHEVDN